MIATTYDSFLLAALGAAIPVAAGAWFVRRKTDAETTDIITNAAGRLVKQLEHRLTDCEARLERSEHREDLCVQRVQALTVELATLRRQVDAGP